MSLNGPMEVSANLCPSRCGCKNTASSRGLRVEGRVVPYGKYGICFQEKEDVDTELICPSFKKLSPVGGSRYRHRQRDFITRCSN
jgi:hypothetical protein